MRRRAKSDVDTPGQDSFLDVVSNLVGILIILVMVIGARAKDALLHVEPEKPTSETTEPVDVQTPKAAVVAVQSDVNNILEKLQTQQFEVAYRRAERDKYLSLITAADAVLEQERGKLDESARQQMLLERETIAARAELDELERRRSAAENTEPPVTVLEHMPTPMAKTVFGKEVHFRLQAGRLTYVPLDELVEKFSNEARQNAWKLRETPTITDMVGPIRGFRLRYTLKRAEYVVDTRAGRAVQQRVELDHFDLIPITDQLGEPFAVALRDDSEFRAILSGFEPNRTTITVWVYPDGYGDFRTLRDELYRLGFRTASRPLPAGQLISGSPDGTRSAAQ